MFIDVGVCGYCGIVVNILREKWSVLNEEIWFISVLRLMAI